MTNPQNPSNWRFTWQATSHSPTITLFVFSTTTTNNNFDNLTVTLTTPHSLFISFTHANENTISLGIPVPRVLIEPDCELGFKAFHDHVEVKLRLLLPVDHPLVSEFGSVVSGNEGAAVEKLVIDSDLKRLSAAGEVELFCRSCSTKLTRNPLRHFREMPSVNWREVADNWFGTCCCSFGGVSEKLVSNFAISYSSEKNISLLSPTTVTLCKNDLVSCNLLVQDPFQKPEPGPECDGDDGLREANSSGSSGATMSDYLCETTCEISSNASFEKPSCTGNCEVTTETEGISQKSSFSCNVLSPSPFGVNTEGYEECAHNLSCCQLEEPEAKTDMGITPDKRSLLDGFLGNAFMARSSNLSADVEWKEYFCPQCSTLLGAYPLSNGCLSLDDRVHLFKCNISTRLPVRGSSDLFRNYDLGRMFSNQILEFGKYELTYRTVVTDLSARSPVLQIVLLNMDSWLSTGFCSSADSTVIKDGKLILRPVIKFLYSFCDSSSESQRRMTEAWIKKNQAEEVFMFKSQIEELTELLGSINNVLPSTCTYLEGSIVSFMPR